MINLKLLKVNDILHWSRDDDHMLGKITAIEGKSVIINWYYDADPDPASQRALGEHYQVDMDYFPPWIEYTNIISEKENLAFLLSRK